MDTTRRRFLEGLAASVAFVGAPGRAHGSPQERGHDSQVPAGIIIDAMSGFQPDPALPDHGFSTIETAGVTIVSPTIGSVVPDESHASSLAGLARLADQIARHADRMLLVRTYADVLTAKKQRKLGILANFQNSTAIGTDLKNLDLFHGLGLRQLQITFNWRNWVGDGCTERTQAGLSYFGVEMIGRMNELGILLDAAHTGYQSTLDAIEVSRRPMIFSHTNCKALCDHPRNKTDDQIRALAQKGGVMGISSFNWFVSDRPRSTLDDLLDHYDHVIRLVGPDHVGIGSDFGLPGWLATEPDEVWESHKRIYSEREWRTLKGRFPPFIAEVNDARRYQTIARGLERRGHSTGVIEKVLGGNFLRVYEQVLAPLG